MPIYEYQCQACKHQFDALQKVSDPLLSTCPECGKNKLTKLLSAPTFKLKGSGWYETDFKSKGKTSAAETKTAKTAEKTDSSGASTGGGSDA